MKKVKSGDALVIPAQTFNTFIDAARDFRSRQQGSAQTAQQTFRSSGIVLVKNASGTDQDRFAVLGIDSPVITPTDNEDEFKNRVALAGVTPTTAYAGKFVILLEPLTNGAIGRGCVSGACPVKVNITDVNHRFADVKEGQASCLASTESGAAMILWRDGAGTGTVWALVNIATLPPVPAGTGQGQILWWNDVAQRWQATTFDTAAQDGALLYWDGLVQTWTILPSPGPGEFELRAGWNGERSVLYWSPIPP